MGEEPFLMLSNCVETGLKNTYLNSKYQEIKEKEVVSMILVGNPQLQAGFSFVINSETYNQFNGKYRMEKVVHKYNNAYITIIDAIKIP
jgi:hypothetical protein